MRLVIDTNVVISGIFWKGIPNKILKKWFDGEFEVFISAYILAEYEEVLKRIGSGLSLEEIREWIELIITHSSIIIPSGKLNVIEADPDDDMFIECAFYGDADFIISGDNHLLKLKEYKGIKIVSPGQFVNENHYMFNDLDNDC